ELLNRNLHIDLAQSATQSAKDDISKCQDCTLKELAILKAVKENSKITQKQLSEKLDIPERSLKRYTVALQEKGFLRRKNGKRNGEWEVLVEL
ncbi:MAG: winged helix-turn-helix transcriptional regulator, partial [Eubacterium sp.]|nr:winged helix-turn-helix transcriptional regulator [Eubacterium sp.]